MELPWHSLRSKLVKVNSAGLVDYHSTFDDFKLHLKHHPEVGIFAAVSLCMRCALCVPKMPDRLYDFGDFVKS